MIGESMEKLLIIDPGSTSQFQECQKDQSLFVFANMQNQLGLFIDGMQPVFRSFNTTQQDRINIDQFLNDNQKSLLTYFPQQQNSIFCIFYQWSCQDNEKFLDYCYSMSLQIPNIYYENFILSYSKEGRPINLITKTIGFFRNSEVPFPGIFPITKQSDFKKPYIFISACLHPGDIPSSFVHNGLINIFQSK